jgi:hypothetical protein
MPVVLNDDGGWCWFQDERALALGERVLIGSVATGRFDALRAGNVEATVWTPATGETRRVILSERLGKDDHNAPAFLELEGGGMLAVFTRHGEDRLVRWRRTEGGPDLYGLAEVNAWEAEGVFPVDPEGARLGVTYSNLYRLSEEGVIVDLFRGIGWDPNVLRSEDEGKSWTWAGRLLGGPGRPYLRYAGNGRDRVHFVATEQHPRDFDNGLYHGFLRRGEVCASDGAVRGRVSRDTPLRPEDMTPVFTGGPNAVAWPADLELDGGEQPVCLFTVQVDGAGQPRGMGGADHRFHYARWDGTRWSEREIAHAGRRLYAGEDDYTGLGAIDPENANVVYISTDAHPVTGKALVSTADGARHRELFRGQTDDAGATWVWEAVTTDSTSDNLRPIVPPGRPRVLLWLRGCLRTYKDYDLEVVGLPLP